MILILVLGFFFAAVLAGFSIGFLINWYRNRSAISAYKRIGLWAGVIFVIFESAATLYAGLSFRNIGPPLALLAWGFLRTWGFVNNGIFFSNQLNIRSFPLVAPRLGLPAPAAAPPADSDVDGAVTNVATLPAAERPWRLLTHVEEASPEPPTPPVNWLRYALNITGVAVGGVAYSVVLFQITQPLPGLAARNVSPSNEAALNPTTLLVLVEVAFVEELIFRLGIQNYLGAKLINKRHGYTIAIILTAAFWSLGHLGSLSPDWVKLAQVFPFGLALGWLYRRKGVESTILAHALFNVLGALLLAPLPPR